MNRRSFLENSSKAGLGVIAVPGALTVLESCGAPKKTSGAKVYASGPNFQQRPLLYDYKSLEPHIDAQTMEIHYTKHAAAYTKNMNDAITEEKSSCFIAGWTAG
jgi:Fe-Mn family superoxide dismutase